MERRVIQTKDAFQTREENGRRYIEGYFSVFNQPYEVFPGWIEEIAPGAFSRTLRESKDVKVLWNHNSDIVLGSTVNRTATLREDDVGLFGSNEINEDDQEAKNGYARVARGDVRGCSFGFEIKAMEERWDDEGNYRTRITDVDLFEVSPCTFPAYVQTSISARAKEELEEARTRYTRAQEKRRDEWREAMQHKLKGEHCHGIKSDHAAS